MHLFKTAKEYNKAHEFGRKMQTVIQKKKKKN